MFWLSTMIVPFEATLDLTATGSSYDFQIDRFYSDKYVCLLEFKIPNLESSWLNRMEEMESRGKRGHSEFLGLTL